MSAFVPIAAGIRARMLCGALFLSLLSAVALAQPPAPPPPTNFFTDTVGVVPAGLAAEIEQRLRNLQKESSNQVLVVVADRVPEGYTSLEEYTNRTAEAWRVGDKSRDNGAVLFVFVGDRKVRIEVGYGLEGALPDALASRIINDEITPRFREGRYGEGLMAAVDAIIKVTKGEYQPKPPGSRRSSNVILIVVVVLFLLIGVVIPILREAQLIHDGYRTYSGTGWSGGHGRRSSGWSSGGGGWSGGGGSSWGGGGGFSGGGGSFGGGGASGSW